MSTAAPWSSDVERIRRGIVVGLRDSGSTWPTIAAAIGVSIPTARRLADRHASNAPAVLTATGSARRKPTRPRPDTAEVRRLRSEGETLASLARRFKVTQMVVRRILAEGPA